MALPAVAFLASAVTAFASPLPEPTLSNVAYGDDPRQVLDFWQAETQGVTPAPAPAPAVVYLHGGAWLNGDKGDIRKRDFGRCLAAGISVVSINYRYVGQADEAGLKPPVSWPMHDAARAVQFVRAHATEWNLDPKRIAMSGTSAGACTSLWIALHDDLAEPASADPVARESTRLACVAVHAAQTTLDPGQMREWTPNSNYGQHAFGLPGGKNGADRKRCFTEFLERRDELLPWIEDYSPMAQASRDDPPVYLVYDSAPSMGEDQKDPTHSANFGVGLKRKLDALGVECELSYPGVPDPRHASMEDYLIDRLGAPGRQTVKVREPEVELPSKESFHIYLLMGQSNMAGRDRRELDRQEDDPRVLALDADGHWAVARDPLHPKQGRTEPGEGPGIAFGKAMADAGPGITIGLIPCATARMTGASSRARNSTLPRLRRRMLPLNS